MNLLRTRRRAALVAAGLTIVLGAGASLALADGAPTPTAIHTTDTRPASIIPALEPEPVAEPVPAAEAEPVSEPSAAPQPAQEPRTTAPAPIPSPTPLHAPIPGFDPAKPWAIPALTVPQECQPVPGTGSCLIPGGPIYSFPYEEPPSEPEPEPTATGPALGRSGDPGYQEPTEANQWTREASPTGCWRAKKLKSEGNMDSFEFDSAGAYMNWEILKRKSAIYINCSEPYAMDRTNWDPTEPLEVPTAEEYAYMKCQYNAEPDCEDLR